MLSGSHQSEFSPGPKAAKQVAGAGDDTGRPLRRERGRDGHHAGRHTVGRGFMGRARFKSSAFRAQLMFKKIFFEFKIATYRISAFVALTKTILGIDC